MYTSLEDKKSVVSEVTLNLQGRSNIFLFLTSIFSYLIGVLLAYIIPPANAQLIQSVALVFILFLGMNLVHANIKAKYFKYMLVIFMISNVTIILRMDTLSYIKIKEYLFSEFQFWPYVVPLVSLIVHPSFLFERLFKWIYLMGIVFIFFSVLLWSLYLEIPMVAEQSIWIFSSGCGFILLTWKYHPYHKKLIALGAIILALYISTILARRNLMLTNINFLLFSFLSYIFFIKGRLNRKVFIVLLSIIVLYATAIYFQYKKNTDFSLITNRITEDTRESVLDFYFADMHGSEWFGKGIDGVYFCPLITEDEEVFYRDIIESGYLQIILKGGIFNLLLFLSIVIPAIILGLFCSKNIFSKAAAIIILLWLIDMIPYGLPSFSFRYILVWICVGICYNKKIREYSEYQIEQLLSNTKA